MVRNSLMLLILGLVSLKLVGQDTVSLKGEIQYKFIRPQDNEIINSTALSPFFEKLYQLRKNKKGVVNVVHIGDSHIQADFLTNTVRQLLQKEFGNAGRGFVFPGRIARTNEPQTVYSHSDASWEAKRIVFVDQPLPIGLGASTIRTTQPDAKFLIRSIDSPPLSYAFNSIAVFYKKDLTSFNITVKDSAGHPLAYAGPYTGEKYSNFSMVNLPYQAHQLEFQMVQPTPAQTQFTLFGLSLSNGKPGVQYHAIGGNGAKFRHYLEAQFFFEQTQSLDPDLFIISLGTNEAIDYPNVDRQFAEQVENFVAKIKQSNPGALILLTTPADFYRKRARRNPGVETVHAKLLELSGKNNWACWDLYAAEGGKHAADQWRKSGLLQADGVHSTRTGYEVQGTLLYQALIQGYNQYVRYRYP